MNKVVKKIKRLLEKHDCVRYYCEGSFFVAYEIWNSRVYWRENEGGGNSFSWDVGAPVWEEVNLSSVKPYTRSHKGEGQRKGESNYDYIVRLIEKGHQVSVIDEDKELNILKKIGSSGCIEGRYKAGSRWVDIQRSPGWIKDFTDIKIHIEEEEDKEIDKEEFIEIVKEIIDDELDDKVEDAVKKVMEEKFK